MFTVDNSDASLNTNGVLTDGKLFSLEATTISMSNVNISFNVIGREIISSNDTVTTMKLPIIQLQAILNWKVVIHMA